MKKTLKKTAYSKSTTKSKTTKQTTKNMPKSGLITSLKKQYLKTSPVCKVTFRLPKEAATNANMVTIVGDFNNWNLTETKMERLTNGDFKAVVELPCSREYRFRYLIDSSHWENDWFADKYVPNDFGSDDSVVITNGSAKK